MRRYRTQSGRPAAAQESCTRNVIVVNVMSLAPGPKNPLKVWHADKRRTTAGRRLHSRPPVV